MPIQNLYEKHKYLQERLRILILQNSSEQEDYDESFLRELQTITRQMLSIKKQLKNHKDEVGRPVFPAFQNLTGLENL